MPNYSIPFFRKLINEVFLKYDSAQREKSIEIGRNDKVLLKNNVPKQIFFEALADEISDKRKENGKQIIPETFQKKSLLTDKK